MGILNITPDSFSDGGKFFSNHAAVEQALKMLDEGADVIDVGGESTRPGATPLTPAQEQERVLPVLRSILAARPDTVVSIDTYHAETARLSVEAGTEIVNDVSGHLWDSTMSATCAELRPGTILTHTRGRPREWRGLPPLDPKQVLPLVLGGLKERMDAAIVAGIDRESIVLDPGFGFGKALGENYPLLAHLDELHALGLPLLAGVSRKSFLTHAFIDKTRTKSASTHLNLDPVLCTAVANTAAILGGAHILRVHDVGPARQTVVVADRILEAAAC
jgi:dihydropteroate synthase